MSLRFIREVLRGQRFDEVFLLPFLTTGGADRYILDVMDALAQARPDTRFLVLFGEPFQKYAWLDRFPSGTVYLTLYALFPDLPAERLDRLTLGILRLFAPTARLHLKGSVYAERFFRRYGERLRAMRPVLYRFCDSVSVFKGQRFIGSGPFGFLSCAIGSIDRIICDNQAIARFDRARIGAEPGRWHVLHARVHPPQRPGPAVLAQRSASERLLWASRLDDQKRPGLLPIMARLLHERLPDMHLDIYGSPLLDAAPVHEALSRAPNVTLHGSFRRFEDCLKDAPFCFLYTSLFDGLPNILLEAAAAGLPLIAPDLGGIGDFISHRQSGLLIRCTGDDAVDAQRYVEAVEQLRAEPGLRASLCEAAFSVLERQHHPALYQKRVEAILGPAP